MLPVPAGSVPTGADADSVRHAMVTIVSQSTLTKESHA